MKVLVINGSPKGVEASNTMRLTRAVLEGILESNPESEIKSFNVKDLDIHSCIGCMKCWGEHPGQCVFRDDMDMIHREFMLSDLVIYSFPLYFFGMPGPMKIFADRMMPLIKTYKGEIKEFGTHAFHDFRYDVEGKRFMVISSCGYGRTYEIFDALVAEFNLIFGAENYDALLCPQGEMFSIPPLEPQINAYLERYREIGRVIGCGNRISEEKIKSASEPILAQRVFEALAKRYWDQFDENQLPAPHLR